MSLQVDSNGIDQTLLKDVVKFLSFQSSVVSGHSYQEDDPRFIGLSPGLKERIQIAVNRPVLENVRMFGWNKEYDREDKSIQLFFERADEDGGGSLDIDEMGNLFDSLNIELDRTELQQCFQEMDGDGDGDITFPEFRSWWSIKKWGHSSLDKAPSEFLNLLAIRMTTHTCVKTPSKRAYVANTRVLTHTVDIWPGDIVGADYHESVVLSNLVLLLVTCTTVTPHRS